MAFIACGSIAKIAKEKYLYLYIGLSKYGDLLSMNGCSGIQKTRNIVLYRFDTGVQDIGPTSLAQWNIMPCREVGYLSA